MQYDRFDLKGHRVYIPSIQLNLLYWEHCIKNEKVRGSYHFHDYWQAEFLIGGEGKAYFDDQEIVLDKERIIIIPPGIRHSFEYTDTRCEYYSFKFNCISDEKIKRPLLFCDPRNILPIKNYIVEFMANDKLELEQVSVHIQNTLKTLIEIELIYDKKVRQMSIADQIRNHLPIKESYFPTADEIALLLDLSRPYLSKKLKEETGLSLKPFLDQERMEHAKTLLHLSDLTISEISYHLGFADIWSFSKFFRRVAGKSPRDFRAEFHL
jgi:AraC-like DNA-binding protein